MIQTAALCGAMVDAWMAVRLFARIILHTPVPHLLGRTGSVAMETVRPWPRRELTPLTRLCHRWRPLLSDTYVQNDLANEWSDYGCPSHSRGSSLDLVGTVCVKNETSATQDVDYVNFMDPKWDCEGRDNDDPPPNMLAIVFINLLFSVGWIPIAVVFCCIFRNKSQNTAPFNGDAVQSFPQAAKANVAQMQVVQMQCPEGVSPGQTVQTNVNGQMLDVQIPAGVAPGTMFQVR